MCVWRVHVYQCFLTCLSLCVCVCVCVSRVPGAQRRVRSAGRAVAQRRNQRGLRGAARGGGGDAQVGMGELCSVSLCLSHGRSGEADGAPWGCQTSRVFGLVSVYVAAVKMIRLRVYRCVGMRE